VVKVANIPLSACGHVEVVEERKEWKRSANLSISEEI
jgi:hypothetical protein